jgi:hypothetical protein
MPIITAFTDHPSRPYVRVEINWADVPAVQYASVTRVDVETGECTTLRPYVCYSGDELLLSCGHGTFWDTEAPFDRPFYYITQSSEAPCIPAAFLMSDTFTRVLVDQWGSPDMGNPYALVGGAPADYDVNGTTGTQSQTSVNVARHSISDVGTSNQDLYAETSLALATAAGADIARWIMVRVTDTNNLYFATLGLTTTGAVTLALTARVGGALTGVGTGVVTVASSIVANERWSVRVQAFGSTLRAMAWPTSAAPPLDWTLSTTTSLLPTGNSIAVGGRLEAGNVNGLPVVYTWDNIQVSDPCAPCTPVTADTGATPTTLVNDGRFWLKDPVRPCNDQPVPLCAPDAPLLPSCGGTGAITFVEIGAEIYADNSLRVRPMNRRRPIMATRPRSDVTTSLVLETTTFTARDQVLELAAPGTPLLFQGPSEYGVPDRYMGVGAVAVERQLPDHRIQFRKVSLPYEAVDRPAGPSQGICGTRVADICDLYPTWDDLAATGFTWDDLIRGAASPESANPNRRTWDDVNAEFADWDAVEAGGRTWIGLLEGD